MEEILAESERFGAIATPTMREKARHNKGQEKRSPVVYPEAKKNMVQIVDQ